MKIKWKKSNDYTVHIYINDKKTNLWYRTKKYEYFNKEQTKKDVKKIINILNIFKSGQIKLPTSKHNLIDSCITLPNYKFTNYKIIDYRPDYKHELCSISGYFDCYKKTNDELIKEVKNDRHLLIQLLKVMNDNGKLMRTIGIYRSKYGYSVYAID